MSNLWLYDTLVSWFSRVDDSMVLALVMTRLPQSTIGPLQRVQNMPRRGSYLVCHRATMSV